MVLVSDRQLFELPWEVLRVFASAASVSRDISLPLLLRRLHRRQSFGDASVRSDSTLLVVNPTQDAAAGDDELSLVR